MEAQKKVAKEHPDARWLKLGEVYTIAKKWAEWRQGQCDWPKGANPEEVALVEALR